MTSKEWEEKWGSQREAVHYVCNYNSIINSKIQSKNYLHENFLQIYFWQYK